MTPNDDDLSQIEADDALLSAIAAGSAGSARPEDATGEGAADDAAAVLLTDIVRAVDGLTPSDSPGGSGRRGRGRRGGLWGISLGVSIVVAAGGGLSAAATDRLPEPVQRFAIEIGQAAPPAEAAPLVITPTDGPAPSGTGADDGTGAPYGYAGEGTDSWPSGERGSWWRGLRVGSDRADGDRTAAGPFTASTRARHDDRSSSWSDSSWSSPTTDDWGSSWGDDPSRYTYAYPQPASYPEPTASPQPTPTGTSTPTQPGYVPPAGPAPSYDPAPTRGATTGPAPTTSPQPQRSGSRNPSPSAHASPPSTSSPAPGHGTPGRQAPHRGH